MAKLAGSPELRATYRLQLTREFGFDAARELIPYLRDLGISHLYLSPSLEARAGSAHGYDVIDPTRISEERGGEDAFRALCAAAHGDGLGVVLDIVPNHMAAVPENPLWADPESRERCFDVDPVSGRHRRFFDIDDLAGARVELDDVFLETHALVLRLVGEGVLDGLRIDHPDGLADPAAYLARLRAEGVERVWVEKILAAAVGERLPADWPVSGTVGYEFLNDVCGLFVDPAAEPTLNALWEEISADPRPFGAHALEAKLEQASTTFTPEVERLARLRPELTTGAIALALSVIPIYRTYEPPSAGEFVTRFQQTTGAITAKGVEDTAFYRHGRLLALNEVGGEPDRFGVSVADFHVACAERALRHPEALLSTMTHDAKRSTDARARIAALTEIPGPWAAAVRRWLELTEPFCSPVDGRLAPDPVERYFIFQTLVGVWPISPERLDEYLEKALREAKRNSDWISPSGEWEHAVKRYARAVVGDERFRAEFELLAADVARRGARSTLGQLVLKLTAPGVPDTYQGDELELVALVDPDNRRPVDWVLRRERLDHLLGGGRPGATLTDQKLWTTARLLALRARRPRAFTASGTYEPLDAGPGACAFLRGGEVLTVVTLPRAALIEERYVSGLPGGRWREILTGDERSFDARLPVARLVGPETGVAVYERL